MPPPANQKCATCNAYEQPQPGFRAQCRAHLPMPIYAGVVTPGLQPGRLITDSQFPETDAQWWCREWQPKSAEEQP